MTRSLLWERNKAEVKEKNQHENGDGQLEMVHLQSVPPGPPPWRAASSPSTGTISRRSAHMTPAWTSGEERTWRSRSE